MTWADLIDRMEFGKYGDLVYRRKVGRECAARTGDRQFHNSAIPQ
jgi:hypothetical protein